MAVCINYLERTLARGKHQKSKQIENQSDTTKRYSPISPVAISSFPPAKLVSFMIRASRIHAVSLFHKFFKTTGVISCQ